MTGKGVEQVASSGTDLRILDAAGQDLVRGHLQRPLRSLFVSADQHSVGSTGTVFLQDSPFKLDLDLWMDPLT
eukprot:7212271-Lingulodinium_polyedra.AAC.1